MAHPLLQFFEYAHLPPVLQEVSAPFCRLAKYEADSLPDNPQKDRALELLIEAKDCAVRAALWKYPEGTYPVGTKVIVTYEEPNTPGEYPAEVVEADDHLKEYVSIRQDDAHPATAPLYVHKSQVRRA